MKASALNATVPLPQVLTVPELRAALKVLGLKAPSSACRDQVVGLLRDALSCPDAAGRPEEVLSTCCCASPLDVGCIDA